MGVRLLSKLLKSTCYDVTKQIHLSHLYGKKICIDTSIYLYRYKSHDMLIENFYIMCSLFKHYSITPIFVFDGRPPIEKNDELIKRRKKRQEANNKYYDLLEKYKDNIPLDKKKEIQKLKRDMTKIKDEDIKIIKDLLDAYGISHITAIGEADKLCASLVIKKKVYAVLTEDMDLFAYACPIILRYFSLLNHTCILYDLKKILQNLTINKTNFQLLCVLSGNDYYENKKNIFYYLKLYNKYNKNKIKNKDIEFKDWLIEHNYINYDDIDNINNIINIYTDINKELNNYKPFTISNKVCDKYTLHKILEMERFIF